MAAWFNWDMNAVIAVLFFLAACTDLALFSRRHRRLVQLAHSRRMARALNSGLKRLSRIQEPVPFQARSSCSSSPSSKATCSSSSAANSAQRSFSKPAFNVAASFLKWSRVRRSISSAA
jgi:hypothetical protein